MVAASKKSPQYLHLLLKAGASVAGHNNCGQSVVSYAAESGDLDRVKEVIARGADFDPKGQSGFWTLWFAISSNNPEMVKYLVKQGVEVNLLPRPESLSILQHATCIKKTKPEIIHILEDAGAK